MAQKENPQLDSFGGPSSQGSSRFPDRISKLGDRRKDTRNFLYWFKHQDTTNRPDLAKAQAKLSGCGNWLAFNHYYTVDQIRLSACHTCDIPLLCSFCGSRRGSKYLQAYLGKFQTLMAQPENRHLQAVMFNLTTKNGDDLEERFKHFMKSLRKLLMRRRDAKRGKTITELSKAVAGVYSVETTNKGKGWHVHMHAIVLLDELLDLKELSREWEGVTGDGSKIVFATRLGYGADMFDQEGNISAKVVESFAEVFKYAVKFSDLDHGDRLHAWEVMRGKRLIGSWGKFRGVEVPPGTLDDLLDDLPYMQLIYRFAGKAYSLARIREFNEHGEPVEEGGRTEGGAEAEHRTDARTPDTYLETWND